MKSIVKKKVAIVTCYRDPDYVRARSLRSAFRTYKDLEVIVLKNKSKGLRRYVEVLFGIVKLRFMQNPDAYVLTFRGYEIVPFLQILAWPKPIIFDEFINLYEWTVEEHSKLKQGSILSKILGAWWTFVLKRCDIILADTLAHAKHSSKISNVPLEKFIVIPVGTDEKLFFPGNPIGKSNIFTVFYYGNMLPLHGLQYVIQAAEELKNIKEINFLLVGGDKNTKAQIKQAQNNGAHITYKKWIQFEDLPQIIRDANLCLGGPFGNTIQSQLVVTGKTYQFLACSSPTLIGASEAAVDFQDGVNSLIVPQGNAKALASKILWAYEHQKQLRIIGKNGYKLYENKFSNTTIADALKPIVQTF